MVEKDKDLFLDMLENPNLTLEDLVSVGHSAESSRFLDKSTYENSQRVRNKFTDSDGNFKQDEFDKWYSMAANAYQDLTNKDTNLSLLNVTSFNESDITVSPDKRTLNTKPIVSFSPNPDRLSTGIFRIGKTSERERTQSELAQAEKVLLNPVEAAQDPSKAKWGDSPNDSWWGNFFDTQVLAQWDEDGTHVDPVTKQTVEHKKGDLKLNDNGTYYYEALDGRDIYGKQVLNKFNTITTDGSFWNQYDFFDSDDIQEKSFVGSVAKNLALVGSMFIPYVGWGIAGASVATQMVGLTGTLGKMLTGSDSPTFSAMEGWSKSLSRLDTKSEYAQQHQLCWENFIDLIGDTTAQLREQRAIFKFVPAMLGKGKYGIQSEHFGMNGKALKEAEMAALRKEANPNLNLGQMARAVGGDDIRGALARAESTKESIISNIADKAVSDYFKDYNKLGEQIARAYMVGLTVGDTYGEAKLAGATDSEATLLTLGYAAAENKLLTSELGRWIFPELKSERATMSQIAKKAVEAPEKLSAQGVESTLRSSGVKEAKAELLGKRISEMPLDVREASKVLGKLDDNSRLAWMKKWFNTGVDIFDLLKSIMKGTMGAAIANALAEGTEEVSEELLKDFSNSCFNIVKAAQGDKNTRMLGFLGTWDWNEALKRYGMSFFGGLVGGGINSAAYDYKQFKDIANMTSDEAMQLLVWMDRNNEMDRFWDIVSKETLGDKYHSTEQNEDGTYKLGDENNNQDLEVKRALRTLINMIHNILSANGANVDDEGLIGQVMNALPAAKTKDVLGDFRANALAKSVTAGRFLKEYNNLCKAIVLESAKLKELNKLTTDSGTPSEDLEAAIKESQDSLKVLQDAKDKLLSGERSAEFYKDAMFETTYGVSESFLSPTEVQFMERLTGKPYALIPKEEKDKLREKYADWSKSERAEQIHLLSDIFYDVTSKTSQALQSSAETYQKIKEGQLKNFLAVTQISANKLSEMMDILRYDPDDKLSKILEVVQGMAMDTPSNFANPMGLTQDAEQNIVSTEGSLSDMQAMLGNRDNVYIDKINEITGNTNLTDDEKVPLMVGAFIDNVHKNLDKTALEILLVGYIHPEVKRNFVPTLNQTIEYCDEVSKMLQDKMDELEDSGNQEAADKFAQLFDRINEIQTSLQLLVDQISELTYTPIAQNLKSFAIGLGTDLSVLDLVEGAINKEQSYQDAVDNIILDEDTSKQYDEADKLLKLYRASIIASRNDNADVDHIFGYNKALNELCGRTDGWVPLAEIDGDTAQLALQDVNLAIDRLNTIRGISDLNQGNKLNVLNYTAANKSYILYNKTAKLLTSLLNEDDDDAKAVRAKWNTNGALDDLKLAIDSMAVHKELSAEKLADRTLSLNSKQKEDIEKELHIMDDAIYNFFQKNLDKLANTEESKKDLALFIKAAKFDLYDKNEGILTQSSEDIDDGSYVWWLAGKAALKGSDFYKEYRKIISDDIAPIPTQELGIYSAIAAIYNGNVFTAFGNAMKQHIYDDWSSKSDVQMDANGNPDLTKPSEKLDILKAKGLLGYLPMTNADIKDVISSDLVPSYTNILFIEGIPGSGKSTGVFKSIVKMLNNLNPTLDGNTKLLDKPIVVAHSTQDNADHLALDLNFKDGTRVSAYGKEELLSWMSPEYKNKENPTTGQYEYHMGKDCIMTPEGNILSNWKVRLLAPLEVPAVMFIDEWSRYTQPEVDLINRFASEYGVQVIAGGDMDQLSPTAYLLQKDSSKVTDADTLEMSIARNITPRVPKLGVSMRTGNGQKNLNLHTLQSWKRNKTTDPVDLLYVETDTDLFGDKAYKVSDDLTDAQLQEMLADIDKLVANLDTDNNEKIGYIYHDTESKLFKLLSQLKYKDKIDFKNEASAQGREARYYIVENNRSESQTDDAYLKSLYTGVSRAVQASIVVVPQNPIGKLTVRRPKKQENKLIPDNFTADGIARFAKQRKTLLDNIYGSQEDPDLSKIAPRELKPVPIVRTTSGAGATLSGVQANALQNTLGTTGLSQQLALQLALQQAATSLATNLVNPLPPNAAPTLTNSVFQKGNLVGNQNDFLKILHVLELPDGNGGTEIWYKVDIEGSGRVTMVSEKSLIDEGYLVLAAPPVQLQQQQLQIQLNPNAGGSATLAQQLTLGTAAATGQLPPATSTVWEDTPNNYIKVVGAILSTLVPTTSGNSQFNATYLERALGTNLGDLSEILSNLVAAHLITAETGGNYTITPDSILSLQNQLNIVQNQGLGLLPGGGTPQTPANPNYKIGDKFKIGVPTEVNFTIKNIEWSDDLNEYNYTLSRGNMEFTRSESQLKAIENAGKFTPREDDLTEDGAIRQPELAATAQGLENLLRLIEKDAELAERPTPELAGVSEDDIDYHILGHTWNTNYLGVQFDEDSGAPILPLEGEPGYRRVDLANGLIKLDPVKFNSEKACREAIGTIRKSAQFDSNERIAEVLKRVIPSLKDLDLDIRWAFISKSRQHNTGDGGRFFYDPLYRLDNMEDFEHAEIPIKTISLLVLDENKNCVLEIPMLTLSSPFTALYQLGLKDPNNKIYQAYNAASKNTSLTDQQVLLVVIDAINNSPETKNKKGQISYGYKRLQDMCKLWQFTNDGVRFIPNMNKTAKNPRGERFNLHAHTLNLGSHYVKNRITEHTIRGRKSPYDYTMLWHDMTAEGQRTDVNYSDIMIATSDYDLNFNRIVAAGHPFVLRSDSDLYITNQDMMDRYLELLNDESLEKIVKLEILTPPEISVSDYLVERAKDKGCNYGNEFTAYRILSIIRKTDPQLWKDLEKSTRNKISPVMDILDNLLTQLEKADDENHLEYMSRIYAEQKQVMIDHNAIHDFSDALFESTWDYNGNDFNMKAPRADVIERIQKLCDQINPETGKKYMTGVLYRPVCVKRELAEPISGFGYLVQTGQNRFTTPDGKSYRIFSRYETPIFDLSPLAGAISNWANSAKQGRVGAGGTFYPNIWWFDDGGKRDYALDFYNAEGNTKKPLLKTPNQLLKEKHANLLEKLGLKDYNRLDTIEDESKFLEAIRDKFIETPGNVAVVVDGNNLLYAKLDNSGVDGTFKFPDEFINATQLSFTSNNAGDNSYTLVLNTPSGTKSVNVELVLGNLEMIFDLGKPEPQQTLNPQPLAPVFDFGPSLTALDDKISKTAAPNVKKKYEGWKQIIEQGIQAGQSRMEIADELLKNAKVIDKGILKTILGKDFFDMQDPGVQAEENLDEAIVCSITVHKKFMK